MEPDCEGTGVEEKNAAESQVYNLHTFKPFELELLRPTEKTSPKNTKTNKFKATNKFRVGLDLVQTVFLALWPQSDVPLCTEAPSSTLPGSLFTNNFIIVITIFVTIISFMLVSLDIISMINIARHCHLSKDQISP